MATIEVSEATIKMMDQMIKATQSMAFPVQTHTDLIPWMIGVCESAFQINIEDF